MANNSYGWMSNSNKKNQQDQSALASRPTGQAGGSFRQAGQPAGGSQYNQPPSGPVPRGGWPAQGGGMPGGVMIGADGKAVEVDRNINPQRAARVSQYNSGGGQSQPNQPQYGGGQQGGYPQYNQPQYNPVQSGGGQWQENTPTPSYNPQYGGNQPQYNQPQYGGGQVGIAGRPQYNQPQYGGGNVQAPNRIAQPPSPAYQGNRQYSPGAGGTYGGVQRGGNDMGGDFGAGWNPNQPQGQGQQPSFTPTPNTALSQLQQTWRDSPLGNIGWLGDKNNRMAAEDYANYYGIPLSNLMLQADEAQTNKDQFAATFGEQQKVNNQQYGLQQAGSRREDTALDFGMFTNQRDFNQAKTQFETTTGLSYDQLAAQIGTANADRELQKYQTDVQAQNTRYGIDTSAMTAANQQELEKYGIDVNARTEQGQQQNQLKIAQLGNDMQRYGIDVGSATERYGVEVGAATAAARLGLDYATLSQEDRQFVRDMALKERTQGQTFQIQQGQLGVQQSAEGRLGRQQSLDESYRRQALAQEAQLMRENYQNQLLQSRYSTFGRAQAPNFRQIGGWR